MNLYQGKIEYGDLKKLEVEEIKKELKIHILNSLKKF